jgi:hypothetical protein
MEGVITRVSVTWAEDIGDGRQERVYTVVADEGKIICAERLEELLDDLALICDQLQAAQDAKTNGTSLADPARRCGESSD